MLDEWACHEGDEVRRLGPRRAPVPNLRRAGSHVRAQVSVRDGRPAARHRQDQLARRFLVGLVPGGEPAAIILRLALRPDLRCEMGIGGVGPYENDARLRARRVCEVDGKGSFRIRRRRQLHDDQLVRAVRRVRDRPPIEGNVLICDVERVERECTQPGVLRPHDDGFVSVQHATVESEGDAQDGVLEPIRRNRGAMHSGVRLSEGLRRRARRGTAGAHSRFRKNRWSLMVAKPWRS